MVPRVLLKANQKGVEGLRTVALAGWADERQLRRRRPGTGEIDEPFDLEMFANTVKSAARRARPGGSATTRCSSATSGTSSATNRGSPRSASTGSRQKLVEANRANLLTLSRADLVQLMDPADVRESETTYLNATFHFVLVEGN